MFRAALQVCRQAATVVSGGRSWRSTQQIYITANRWTPVRLSPAVSLLHLRCLACSRPVSTKAAPVGDLQSALARTENVSDVLDVWEAHKDSVYTHNVVRSCLYYSLKAARNEHISFPELLRLSRFDQFWQHLTDQVPTMSANNAIKCLYNCAQYNLNHEPLSTQLISVCTKKSKSIPSISIGILLWSLKRLDLISSNVARPLVSRVTELFHAKLCSGERFKPQTFTNAIWVLASAGALPVHLRERAVEYLPQHVNEFDFHSLSLCLWSLTTAGASLRQQLLDAAGSAAARFLQREKNVPNTVHCCWAFASAEYYHEEYCRALTRVILEEPSHSPLLTPRLLSSVAWMCAKVCYYDSSLLDGIATLAMKRLYRFNGQDLGNLAFAYAQLNHPHETLISAITTKFVSDHKLMQDDPACVSIAWANLAINNYPLPLLKHMMAPDRVSRLIENGEQNNLNFLLRLQGLLRAECPDLRLTLPHETAVFAAALVQSRWFHIHTKFHQSIVKALLQIVGSSSRFTIEALTRTLYFIDIELILDSRDSPISIPAQWRSWENMHSLATSSIIEKSNPELHAVLKDLCRAHSSTAHATASQHCSDSLHGPESLPQPLSLASDWAELAGQPEESIARRVAIEADGPWHYAVNCSHRMGKTLLKHRTLRALGWDVISIPYFEWQQLETEQAQINFLVNRIFKAEDNYEKES